MITEVITYQVLGFIVGFLIAYIASNLDSKILKALSALILYVLFGIIALYILNETLNNTR